MMKFRMLGGAALAIETKHTLDRWVISAGISYRFCGCGCSKEPRWPDAAGGVPHASGAARPKTFV